MKKEKAKELHEKKEVGGGRGKDEQVGIHHNVQGIVLVTRIYDFILFLFH